MERYMSVDQVGEVLGVTYKTALKVVNELPHIKVGGKLLRVSETDLQRWIRQKTVSPNAEPESPAPRRKRQAAEDWSKYLDENGMIPYRRSKRSTPA